MAVHLAVACDVCDSVVLCYPFSHEMSWMRSWNLIGSISEGIPTFLFIAGRSKADLLFWFFGDFRCRVPLIIVILVIYKYK